MIDDMMIGQLAAKRGLSVRTLRFYADAGVLPAAGRTASGYRVFGADAVARARLIRTLRELGVGLVSVKRVLAAESSLVDVAAQHARALEAQIAVLRVQRAVLLAFVRSSDPRELARMTALTALTALTAEERRRIVDEYLDAVFGDDPSAVADKVRMGTPELPEDPTADQVAAWVEVAQLLRDPEFVAASRRMAERARRRARARRRPARGRQGGRRARRSRPPSRGRSRVARSPGDRRAPRSLGATPPEDRARVAGSRRSPTAASAATGRSWAS